MNDFFQSIAGLPPNRDNWTLVGIDGALAGEKAVLSDGRLVYRTEGFPRELLGLAEPGKELPMGCCDTERGRIFSERLCAVKKIVLCGGGHVSLSTLQIARLLEFDTTVIEDRPSFAQAAREAGADHVICENFINALQKLPVDRDTYIVIMTRGHRHDLECLRTVLNKEYAYLGMMGSRGRIMGIRRQLLEEGFLEQCIEKLHAPIGLSIGAVTPAEIAVSVMAEVIAAKSSGQRETGYEKEVKRWLFDAREKEPAVLVTIVGRRGSAPRPVGTKMLVLLDGSLIGTIGGGCMEAEVAGIARHMLAESPGNEKDDIKKSAKAVCRTCFVDMSGRDAEEEGMACGGTLELFLEIL